MKRKINKKIAKRIISSLSVCAVFASSASAFAMSTWSFDYGMSKGINYYNAGKYTEAKDEFQWFCDANWGNMNDGQRKYALDYLDSAKAKANASSSYYTYPRLSSKDNLSQSAFDSGMAKGIEYFNKNMYYEAADEFQWFCDANWAKMNDGQKEYVLDYLNGAKAKFKEYVTMYKYDYTYKYVDEVSVHKSRISEFTKKGWSTSYPKTNFEVNYTSIENAAVQYFKNWLYWPDNATIYNTRVGNTQDDWKNGILYATVYIDANMLSTYGYFSRGTVYVELSYNKYTGEFSCDDIEEF